MHRLKCCYYFFRNWTRATCHFLLPLVDGSAVDVFLVSGVIEQIYLSLLASGGYKKAPGSFLFSLVNPCGLPPTKMRLIAGREEWAIYCDSSCGPTFGGSPDNHPPTFGYIYRTRYLTSESHHDLEISSLPNSTLCTVRLNGSYQCPTSQDATKFLTGNESFTVSEMEVFGFE